MRALVVQGRSPPAYWGYAHSLPFIGKAATHPPLGLDTLAAHLPPSWGLRIKDLHLGPVSDEELRASDAVLVSGPWWPATGTCSPPRTPSEAFRQEAGAQRAEADEALDVARADAQRLDANRSDRHARADDAHADAAHRGAEAADIYARAAELQAEESPLGDRK